VSECGAEPINLGIAPDKEELMREKIEEGLKADALITSAGISVGERDLVRPILDELSVHHVFWKANIKPGKPIAFGTWEGKPVFSLPGNPVSAMITFEEFVRPALLRMMGRRDFIKPHVKAILREPIRKKAGRVEFWRVTVDVEDGEYFIRTSGDQQSGILRTLILANGLAVLPADRTSFDEGEAVDVHLLY
jgi:molybdopterin molybdotransferase